ncbi:MAG TPA: V-type ATP synthase subunit I [Candidatus Scatomorpha intestinavium]|uniref:V-type ATP synthase subunit I n=1 Tax=Candidatus Scatomorpha intestinavium TaxID=2840922 RepID=A0A9D0ZCE9_9FIRM|nr:V-type ATP synthase subunit I [Candidatus Scatomorpha intestinavium]
MIERMKKLTLLAVASERKALLKDLMLLGCVELTEQAVTDDSLPVLKGMGQTGLATEKARHAAITNALKLLDKYAPAKKSFLAPLPDAELNVLLDETTLDADVELSEHIAELEERIRRASAEEAREKAAIEALTPWAALDLPLGFHGTERAAVTLCSFPAALDMAEADLTLGAAAPEAQLLRVSDDRSLHYAVLVCLREEQDAAAEALRPLGFSIMTVQETSGTAKEGIAAAEARLAELAEEKQQCASAIASHADSRDELKLRADTLSTRIDRAEAESKLLRTESTVCLTGWVLAEREAELAKTLEKYDCAWETAEPGKDEYPEVPVKLKNNRVTRALNMVTEMYSLPAYDGVDPNPLMAPFFILFYGIMLADMAYGLIMIIAALVVLKKKKPRKGTRNFFELMLWCGISTTIMGALTGGFFSDAPLQIAQIINPDTTWQGLPALFTPLDDTIMILIGAMCLGFIQIITGMIISVVEKVKNGEIFDAVFNEGTWWVIFIGLALWVLGIGSVGGVPVVLAIGGVMLFIGSAKGKKGFGIFTGFIGAIYNGVTGYFGDILSYSRLMALMLAGSVIAQVFNTIGAIFGNVFIFIIISLFGNALNFALNLLGCFVHDLRLQCLEFFKAFYKDGGKPFKPLEINTKYVTVTNTDK